MDKPENWNELSWEQKREVRFQRWLNPEGVKFINDEAEELYKQRVTRFIKAIKLEEPDRVPVMLPAHVYPAYYGGADFRTMMYDYGTMRKCWIKFMDDFGDMDTFNGPGLIPSGKISEAMRSRINLLPGIGLSPDSPTNQFVEGEYMYADEYDRIMIDESDFYLRTILPRTIGLFESFRNLPPIRSFWGESWVAAMANPEIRKTFQTLMDLTDEYWKWRKANAEVRDIVISRGYPPLMGAGLMAGAPFDHFADTLRGTKGITMDMFRQPQKLLDAMERNMNVTIETVIKDFPLTNGPIAMMPLHKGDDTFMSDEQFATFYWPTLRGIFLAMINEGLVPMPFAEGRYTLRLKQINDTPPSGVVWYFDQTDMEQAKKILSGVCCIAGNLPTSVVMTGTPEQVKDGCRQLIETCAPGGGYILAAGASVEYGDIRNLKAMMESAYEYGVYK